MDELQPYQRGLHENVAGATVGLRGLWAAKLWIVLPVIIALPVMWLFGEGDYIVPILCALWLGCLRLGLKFYRSGDVGTVRKSMGLHTMVWSALLALMTFALTVAIAADGNWRWVAPERW
jgi:hypothetical protein